MDPVRHGFAYEMVKTAEKKSRQSYSNAVVALAPAAVLKSISDVPKGVIDKNIRGLVRRGKTNIRGSLGTGMGRATGAAAGVVTLPLFLSGIKDLKSGDKKKRRRGYAKVLGAAGSYSAGKGAMEAFGEGVVSHAGKKAVLKRMSNLVGSRSITGTLAGAATAAAVAGSMKKGKRGRRSKKSRYLLPAASGAVIGAGKGAFDDVFEMGRRGKWKRLAKIKGVSRGRYVAGGAAGRAAAGAMGALALSEVARYAFKKERGKIKKAEASPLPSVDRPLDLGPTPGQLYYQMRARSEKESTDALMAQYKANLKRGAESTPSRRAVHYAVHDELVKRGERPETPKMRGQVQGPTPIRNTGPLTSAAMASVVVAPSLVWNLGLRGVEASAKDQVLTEALDNMIAARGILRLDPGKNIWGVPDARYQRYMRGDNKVLDVIRVGKRQGPEVLAHELGHATAGKLRRATTLHPVARNAWAAAQIPAILLPLIALNGMGDPSFTTKEEMESRARFLNGIGIATGALSAPVLAEEGIATIKGLKYLQRAGASPARLVKATGRLGVAFSTYAAAPMLPFLAAAYLKRKARKSKPLKARKKPDRRKR